MNIRELIDEYKDCPCGREHICAIEQIVIKSGCTAETGKILSDNGFGKRLVFVADKNTLKASEGILQSLGGFDLISKVYENKRTATMEDVIEIEGLLAGADGVLSVGTGSLHDICRLAAARKNKKLALFATAASMDGFASDSAPITDGCFKESYPAKPPEVIIADTKILANAPPELKSAGLGDMIGKYIGLIDWQISALFGEYYCERVAGLTRLAAGRIMQLSGDVLSGSEQSAQAVFEALILTGVGMSFTKNSRPASGTEHILSHFWECKKLLGGKISDLHGKKVGVATLLIMKEYQKLAGLNSVKAHGERVNWKDVYAAYGDLSPEVKRLNSPPVTMDIEPDSIEKNWQKIRGIIAAAPPHSELLTALKKAGAPTTCSQINVSLELEKQGLKYHPFMRRRLSLMRLKPMID